MNSLTQVIKPPRPGDSISLRIQVLRDIENDLGRPIQGSADTLCWRAEHENESHSIHLRLCFPCLSCCFIGFFSGPWCSWFACSTSHMRLIFIGSLSPPVCPSCQGNSIRSLIPPSIPRLQASVPSYLTSSLASTWSFQTLPGLNFAPFVIKMGH